MYIVVHTIFCLSYFILFLISIAELIHYFEMNYVSCAGKWITEILNRPMPSNDMISNISTFIKHAMDNTEEWVQFATKMFHYDNGAWFLIERQGLTIEKFAVCRRLATYALMGFIVVEDPKAQFGVWWTFEIRVISRFHSCNNKFLPVRQIRTVHRPNDKPFHEQITYEYQSYKMEYRWFLS